MSRSASARSATASSVRGSEQERERGHVGRPGHGLVSEADRTLSAPWSRSSTASAAPIGHAECGSRSTPPAASRSCCRAARPRARRPRRSASSGRGSSGGSRSSRARARRSRRAATPSRTSGERCAVVPSPGALRVHRRGDELLVPAGDERATPALERWYRRAARTEIAPRLQRACALAGTSYSRLTIRGQRTRWASCSRSGAMSFNWRLLLAPEPVLDYVVWHEVCHLEVHGPLAPVLAAAGARAARTIASTCAGCGANGPTLVL